MNRLAVSYNVGGNFSISPDFQSAVGTTITSGLAVNISGESPPVGATKFKILSASGSPDPVITLCYSDFTSGTSGSPCEVAFKLDGASYSDISQITSSGYNYSIGPLQPAPTLQPKRICVPSIAGSSLWDTPVNIRVFSDTIATELFGRYNMFIDEVSSGYSDYYQGFELTRQAGQNTFRCTWSAQYSRPNPGWTQVFETAGTIRTAFSLVRQYNAENSLLSSPEAYTFRFASLPPALVV